jgi:hypothetical protein
MNVTFYDMEDDANPMNEKVISNSASIRKILLSLQEREPFCCELTRKDGSELVIGIGPIGFAEYSRDGHGPYFSAITAVTVAEGPEEDFLCGGTSSPVAARFCLPFDDVIRIVIHFMETGEPCPSFSWEMI